MNLVATLLLSLAAMQGTIVSSQRSRRSGYTCRPSSDNLENCQNNPRIRVTKDSQRYNVRVCTTGDCLSGMPDADLDWIRCNSICEACNALMSPGKITLHSTTVYIHCQTPLDVRTYLKRNNWGEPERAPHWQVVLSKDGRSIYIDDTCVYRIYGCSNSAHRSQYSPRARMLCAALTIHSVLATRVE